VLTSLAPAALAALARVDVPWRDALDALPWVVAPFVVFWRARDSRSLDELPDAVPDDAPLVSVIVPARDEARNVERCLRSVLATRWPRLEVLLVDDHSVDGTADIARRLAAEDPRLRVLDNPPLPPEWFGKQWACTTGAAAARGALLCFVDADTTHAPDLLPRAVQALRTRGVDLLSVIGRQEMGSFWEKVGQPQVLAVILGRFGGTERVSRARKPIDVIANGQFMLVTREAYDAVGGHASVRDIVVEDLKLAQRVLATGRRLALYIGEAQLSTRMYTSLAELMRGWRKNIFAGGREAMPLGVVGQLLFPFLLCFPSFVALWPLAALALAAAGVSTFTSPLGALVAAVATLGFWIATYRRAGLSGWWALTYPLGAVLLLVIAVQAIARGQRVEWRGREYVSAYKGGGSEAAPELGRVA
jgi:chlorobactene glucosyltransferase